MRWRKIRSRDGTRPLNCPTVEIGIFEILSKDLHRSRAEESVQIDYAHKVADGLIRRIFCSDSDSKRLVYPLSFGGIANFEVVHPSGRELPNRAGCLRSPSSDNSPKVSGLRLQAAEVPLRAGGGAEQLRRAGI